MDSDDIQSQNSQSNYRRGKRSRINSQSHSSPRPVATDASVDELAQLANVNPQLMTERQQLAFLLRQTAKVKPDGGSTSSSEGNGSSDDVTVDLSYQKIVPKRQSREKERKQQQKETYSDSQQPSRKKRQDLPFSDLTSEKSVKSKEKSPRSHSSSSVRGQYPSEEHLDFKEMDCAICCTSNSSSGPLMLCKSCDEKYPTQESIRNAA